MDFFALIQDKVVVCMQVKGGQYRIIDGNWHLETDDGLEYTPCPMKLTWDSAMAVRDFLKDKIGRKIFMVAVLLLPDMEPDRDIEMIAESDKTSVMFGYNDIVERVVDLAEDGMFMALRLRRCRTESSTPWCPNLRLACQIVASTSPAKGRNRICLRCPVGRLRSTMRM